MTKLRGRKPTEKSAAIIGQRTTVEMDRTGVRKGEGEPGELVPKDRGKDLDLNRFFWIRDYFEILMKAVDSYFKRSPRYSYM